MTSAVNNSQAIVVSDLSIGDMYLGSFSIPSWVLLILFLVGLIQLFNMVQIPAWKALIPGYNFWVLASIIKLPPISILLWLVPYANVIYSIIFMAKLAKAFNRGLLMIITLIVCMPIAIFIMGFSKNTRYIY